MRTGNEYNSSNCLYGGTKLFNAMINNVYPLENRKRVYRAGLAKCLFKTKFSSSTALNVFKAILLILVNSRITK